jgi:O-antigen ligase
MIGVMLFLATLVLFLFKVKNKKLPQPPRLALALRSWVFKKEGSKKWFNFRDVLVVVLIVLSFVSLSKALNFSLTLKLNLVLLSFGMIYFLARFYLQEKQRKLEALWFFVATSLPILLFGIYQAVAYKMNWLDFQVFAERANGTFTEPDWFGIYLVFLAALIYWVKLYLFRTKNDTMIGVFEIRKVGQWVLNVHLLLVILVLLLTVARSAWVGFVALTATYFFCLFYQKRIFKLKRFLGISFWKEFLTMAWVGLLALLIVTGFRLSNFDLMDRAGSSVSGLQEITISCEVGSMVPERVTGVEELEKYDCQHIRLQEIQNEIQSGNEVKTVFRPDPNVEIRKNIYQTTWREIRENFWLGQGLGSSSEVLGTDSYGHGFNASNIFLEVWFSLGLFGLLVFGWLFLDPIIKGFGDISNKYKAGFGLNSLLILTGIALLVPNLFNSGIFLSILWVWLALGKGLVVEEK